MDRTVLTQKHARYDASTAARAKTRVVRKEPLPRRAKKHQKEKKASSPSTTSPTLDPNNRQVRRSCVEAVKKLFSPSVSKESTSSSLVSSSLHKQVAVPRLGIGAGLAMGSSISMFGVAAINAKRAKKKRAAATKDAKLTPRSKLASDVRMISAGLDAADGAESEELASLGTAEEEETAPSSLAEKAAAGHRQGSNDDARRTHDPIARQLREDAYKAEITPIKIFRQGMRDQDAELEGLEILVPQKIRA